MTTASPQGVLYVTGTPIGNLEDITLRQLRILRDVDFIAAEDTRVTRGLLSHFDIHTPLTACNEHSALSVYEDIADRIAAGERCAVVTDAGMPCISDPGERLVRLCRERGIRVEAVPGPSAVVTALSVSGGSTAQFAFYAFLPTDKKSKKLREQMLTELSRERKTCVLYEAPHKLRATLDDLERVLGGEREIAFCRELTKFYEEVLRMTVAEAVAYYAAHEPRGEFVLVIDGMPEEGEALSVADAVSVARAYMEQGMSGSAAAKLAAKETGVPKSEIYRELHQD